MAAKYPSLRGLTVEHREPVATPHYAPDPFLWRRERDAYDAAVAEMWRLCEQQNVHGADVLSALGALVRNQSPAGSSRASVIAAAGLAMQKGDAYGFYGAFDNTVDTIRGARYSLFVMESGRRGFESNRLIGVPDAVEAAGLTAELADYGMHSDGPDSPFDVAIYTLSPLGKRVDFQPMVWSGASSHGLRFPESILTELRGKGIDLGEEPAYSRVIEALAPHRESRARHGFGFHL